MFSLVIFTVKPEAAAEFREYPKLEGEHVPQSSIASHAIERAGAHD